MAQVRKHAMDVTPRKKAWLQSVEICCTVQPSFVTLEPSFFHEWINLYLAKGLCQFSVALLFAGKEKCACFSDKPCQKFTRPNQISTCPRQRFCRALI